MKLTPEEKSEIESHSEHIINQFAQKFNIHNLKDPFISISSLPEYLIIRTPSDDAKDSKRKTLSGFSISLDLYNCIYINSNHTLGRQHFTCWHEFYHRFLDSSDTNFELCEHDEMEEKKADYFASCMLIPKNDLKQFIFANQLKYNDLTILDFIKIQHNFQCSLAVAILRTEEIYGLNYSRFKQYSNLNNVDELKNLTASLNLPLNLIQPTRDFVLPKIFLKSIKNNLQNSLISKEVAYELYIYLEENEVEFLW